MALSWGYSRNTSKVQVNWSQVLSFISRHIDHKYDQQLIIVTNLAYDNSICIKLSPSIEKQKIHLEK